MIGTLLRSMAATVVGIAVLGTCFPTQAAEIARWSMNEGSGEQTASSVGSPGADATFFGDPVWTSHLLAPVAGNSAAIQMPGNDETFLLANTLESVLGDGARTISAWIRTTSGENLTIVDAGEEALNSRFTFRMNNNAANGVVGALRLEVSGGFAVANTPINDGQWHHVAVTLPAAGSVDDVSMYVDGALDGDLATVPFSGVTDTTVNTTNGLVRIGQRVNGQFNFDGVIDEVRLWDEQLSAAAIDALVPAGPLPVFEFVVNRDSGNISLNNNYGATVDEIVGYSLRSATGTLDPSAWLSVADNYDSDSGTPTFDGDDTWFELTDTAAPTGEDLSEFAPNGDGGGLANAASLNLGDAWVQFPVEDIVGELIFAGGDRLPVAVRYTGNGGDPFLFGDLNLSGDIDPGDWETFRMNLLSSFPTLPTPQAYLLGDLDFDGDNDRFDFGLFEELYDDARGVGALQALIEGGAQVPEPASWLLVVMGGLLFGLLHTQRIRALKKVPARVTSSLCALLIVVGASGAVRADVLAYYDFESPNPYNDRAGTANGVVTGTTNVATGAGAVGDAAFFGAGILPAGTNSPDEWITVAQSQAADFGTGDISVSLWYRRAEPQGDLGTVGNDGGPDGVYDSLAGTTSGVQLFMLADGRVNGRFDTADGGFFVLNSQPGGIEANTGSGFMWHHIAYSVDRTSGSPSATLYVDGVVAANVVEGGDTETAGEFDDVLGANVSPSQDFLIGAANNTPADGGIDDLAFFDQALTQQEVIDLMNGDATPLDFFERLKLEVNIDTGAVTLTNNTTDAIDFDYYEITSATDSLNAAAWSSMESRDDNANGFPAGDGSGNGWEEAGGSSDGGLGETFLDGFSSFGAATNDVGLGSIFRTAGSQDLAFVYRDAATGVFKQGIVEYVMGGALAGDFNGDGTVDAADYTVWRDNLGADDESAFAPGTGNGGGVDSTDYDHWRANFGNTRGSLIANSGAVPEPNSLALVVIAALGLLARRSVRAGAVLLTIAVAASASAAVTIDRLYTFGDDLLENGDPGQPIGTATGGDTFDSWGDPFTGADIPGLQGEFVDLAVDGGAVYTGSVAPQASPHNPTTNDVAAEFDGVDDYLSGLRLGFPETSASSTLFTGGVPGPIDYEGIANRGFQLWVNPDVVGGSTRTIVRDTAQHGLAISESGTWVLRYGGQVVDSGVAASANVWTHAMVVRPSFDAGTRLYIDGVAVAAAIGGYTATDDTPLAVGANLDGGGAPLEFFDGTLDEMEMFVTGTSTDTRARYGTFNALEDNDFIAAEVTVLGDLTGDNLVTTADVERFMDGWLSVNVVDTVQVGDLNSYADGDLNFDGIVDIGDAAIFNGITISAGLGALDFSQLGGGVPEPTSLLILATGFGLLLARTRR